MYQNKSVSSVKKRILICVIILNLCSALPSFSQKKVVDFFYVPEAIFDPKNYFETIQYYNQELDSMSTNTGLDSSRKATVYYLRGRSKFELTDKRGAVLDFDLAVSLDSAKPAYYYYRGLAHHWLKHYSDAIENYDMAVKLKPDKMHYYLNRGYVKFLLDDLDGACYDFSKAGELGLFEAYELIKEYCN